MNATRILWGQVIAVFGVTLTGIWAATQWTAHALAYQPELGESWFSLGSWPIYPPPAFFWWWFAFDAYAPKIFETGALIAVSGAMAGIVIRSEEHTSELQSLMRISYAVFCLKKKKT